MIGFVRRMGIAIGSLVAATLVVGLVWGLLAWVLTSAGAPLDFTGSLASPVAGTAGMVVTFVFGGLIYRDILRRERRP